MNYLEGAATRLSAQLRTMVAEQWWAGLTLLVHWEARTGGVECCDQQTLCTPQDFTHWDSLQKSLFPQ